MHMLGPELIPNIGEIIPNIGGNIIPNYSKYRGDYSKYRQTLDPPPCMANSLKVCGHGVILSCSFAFASFSFPALDPRKFSSLSRQLTSLSQFQLTKREDRLSA